MNIYLHFYGRKDPKQYLVWMGNGTEDGMHNFRLLAAQKENNIEAKTHLAMVDITDAVTPHLDLIARLALGDTFRDESLYGHVLAPPAQGMAPLIIIERAGDMDEAKVLLNERLQRLAAENPVAAVPHDAYRQTINLGDGLAILKDKIAKYWPTPAVAAE